MFSSQNMYRNSKRMIKVVKIKERYFTSKINFKKVNSTKIKHLKKLNFHNAYKFCIKLNAKIISFKKNKRKKV